MRGVLESLGFGCEEAGEGTLKVDAPYWRTDIGIEDDLVEEVAPNPGLRRHSHHAVVGPDPAQRTRRCPEAKG